MGTPAWCTQRKRCKRPLCSGAAGAVVQRCGGAAMQRYSGAAVQRYSGAAMQRYNGAAMHREALTASGTAVHVISGFCPT
eukprot:scaffold112347_cov39-Phaeocystis_antarctica.AAC.1